ncbi:MAG: 50S ribosomal protein L19 [Bacteroidota bacterium]
MKELIDLVQAEYRKDANDIPDFSAGDTVNLHILIREGEKERIQQFKGVVIQRKGKDATATITVRKISGGIGVERIIPLHSPNLAKIEVVRRGRVRRSRIYYMRERQGKSARIKENYGYKAKA